MYYCYTATPFGDLLLAGDDGGFLAGLEHDWLSERQDATRP